jgi:hypothetical protein
MPNPAIGQIVDAVEGSRVQLRRTKGWKMPPDTVKVDRSTPWGNPWPVGEWGPLDRKAPDAEGAVGLFRQMMTDPQMRSVAGFPADLSPLRGKSLACWCKPGSPCHADVLLEFAALQAREAGE